MSELIVADEHSLLYDVWLERGVRNINLCHVDFHCDMCGLLIERRHGMARYVWQCDPYINRLDSGSFLAHAVMNGIVARLRWVHDAFGGREYDDLYCVKYESDLSALPFRLTGRHKWVPLKFTEQTFDEWNGPRKDEKYLSLDWDGLAYNGYDEEHIGKLTAAFLAHTCWPEVVFVSRSPQYSHPDRALFDAFITALEQKLDCKATWLLVKQEAPFNPPRAWIAYHLAEYRILRLMRKLGVY